MNRNEMCELMDEIIEETCYSESETLLFHAVLQQLGDLDSILQYPQDYLCADSGVSGFIYYTETEKFAKDNLVNIITVLAEFEDELGTPLAKDTDHLFNWYAWFSLEHIANKINCFVDNFNGDWDAQFEENTVVADQVCTDTVTVDLSRFPDKCATCGSPAYLGLHVGDRECSAKCGGRI